jgi:hypothetical protein
MNQSNERVKEVPVTSWAEDECRISKNKVEQLKHKLPLSSSSSLDATFIMTFFDSTHSLLIIL